MIVIYDARCGTLLQSELHDFTRMHRCSVDRAAEEIDALDDPVPFIKEDQSEHLVIQVAQPHPQVFTGLLRRLQRGPATHTMREHLSRRDEDCLTRCRDYRAVGAQSIKIMIRHHRSPDLSRAGLPDPERAIAAQPSGPREARSRA